ncbi:MAG: hypothetical protein Q9184_001894 [Pyrenodesmia sp. 2 TL-2023]
MAIVLDISLSAILLVFFATLLTALAWFLALILSVSLRLLDRWMTTICSLPWVRPKCVYACSKAPWLGLYLFANACSYSVFRTSHIAQAGMAPLHDFVDDMDSIPRLLSTHRSACSYHQQAFPNIQEALAISEGDKDALRQVQDEICLFIDNLIYDLPRYYIHTARYSEAMIYQTNLTQGQIRALGNGSSREVLVQLKSINETWHRNYNILESPGRYLRQDLVSNGRNKVAKMQAALTKARQRTVRASAVMIENFPLPRRVGRALGILRLKARETEPYDEAIEALDSWSNATASFASLVVVIHANITAIDRELSDLASTKFAADVQNQLGPEGLFQFQAYMVGMEQQAWGLRRIVGNVRSENTQESGSGAPGNRTD